MEFPLAEILLGITMISFVIFMIFILIEAWRDFGIKPRPRSTFRNWLYTHGRTRFVIGDNIEERINLKCEICHKMIGNNGDYFEYIDALGRKQFGWHIMCAIRLAKEKGHLSYEDIVAEFT